VDRRSRLGRRCRLNHTKPSLDAILTSAGPNPPPPLARVIPSLARRLGVPSPWSWGPSWCSAQAKAADRPRRSVRRRCRQRRRRAPRRACDLGCRSRTSASSIPGGDRSSPRHCRDGEWRERSSGPAITAAAGIPDRSSAPDATASRPERPLPSRPSPSVETVRRRRRRGALFQVKIAAVTCSFDDGRRGAAGGGGGPIRCCGGRPARARRP